jgi:hypothetical protein
VASRLDKYRTQATECARLALRFSDEKIKLGYEELARSWSVLADRAEIQRKQSRERETA